MSRFAFLVAAVFSVAGYAERCDHRDISRHARALERAAQNFAREVQADGYHKHLIKDAHRLARQADQLEDQARKNAPCQRVRRDYETDVQPAFRDLADEFRKSDVKHGQPQIRRAWRQVFEAHRELGEELKKSGPGPGPGPGPKGACHGMEGGYAGTCRASAGTSPIAFSVAAQGGQCVAFNSQYFQNVVLVMGGGKGTAGVVGHPGGVAIQNTTLTVYGQGRFQMTGYNSAGKFYFNCAP